MRATLFKIIIIIIMTTLFRWRQLYLKDNSSSSSWEAAVLAVTPFIFKNDTIDLTTVLITITIVHNIVHFVHHIHCHCSHHSFNFITSTFIQNFLCPSTLPSTMQLDKDREKLLKWRKRRLFFQLLLMLDIGGHCERDGEEENENQNSF